MAELATLAGFGGDTDKAQQVDVADVVRRRVGTAGTSSIRSAPIRSSRTSSRRCSRGPCRCASPAPSTSRPRAPRCS